jgi:undecaprenyl-diphosphatase
MNLSKCKYFLTLITGSLLMAVLLSQSEVMAKPHAAAVVKKGAIAIAHMNIFQSLVLGFVQGITEFLPISSTAHLKVVPVLLGWGDPGTAYTAVIQLGSIIAVLSYFWADLRRLVKGALRAFSLKDYYDYDFRMCLSILLGTLPILFFGIMIKIFIPDFDHSPVRKLSFIAIASIVMSILLGIGEKFGRRQRDFEKLQIRDGLLMGAAQALALMPGVSRSGSTLTAGLLMGLERETAARFSFLLGIPAITLAGLVELKDAVTIISGDSTGITSLIVGLISAIVFSYLAIAGLLRFLKTQNTWVFIWYRLAFGIGILALISAKVVNGI